MTNNEFFETIYKPYQERHMTAGTCYSRCSIIKNRLLESRGHEKLSDISNMDINSIYEEMELQKYAQNTLFGTYAALLSFFKMAVELGEIDDNPVSLAKTIRQER